MKATLKLSGLRVLCVLVMISLCIPFIPQQNVFAATRDVTAYGATGGDTTDDTTAIQNAINAAAAGDTVYFPAGTYYIYTALIPKSGIIINGTSQSKAIVKFNGTLTSSMIQMPMGSNISNVEISNLTLDGNNDPEAFAGIEAHQGTGHNIHNLIIKNFVGPTTPYDYYGPFGILLEGTGGNQNYINGVTNSKITDNTITNIGITKMWGGAVRLSWGSTGNQVLRNTIANTGRGGIFANDGCKDTIVRNNTISGSGMSTIPEPGEGLGIEIFGDSGRSIIEDNTVDHWISLQFSNYSAVRRNTVSDTSGVIKFIGLEAAETSNNVFTNNLVDGGQQMGISVSGKGDLEQTLWAYNTVQNMVQWGAQIQGDTNGAKNQYFYKNKFLNTQNNNPEAIYPDDDGHGFRVNGGTTYFTFDGNEIKNNGALGIQFTAANGVNSFSFVNNIITGNVDDSIDGYPASANNLEWSNNTVSGNGGNVQLTSRGFSNQKPTANFTSVSTDSVGQAITFTNTSSDPDGAIVFNLWDFGDGIPVSTVSPAYTYTKAGTYTVTLVVWDTHGRSAIKEKTIIIN